MSDERNCHIDGHRIDVVSEEATALARSLFPDRVPEGAVIIERLPNTAEERREAFADYVVVGQMDRKVAHRLAYAWNALVAEKEKTYEPMPTNRRHACYTSNPGGHPTSWVIYEERHGYELFSTDAYGGGSIANINYCPFCGVLLMTDEEKAKLDWAGRGNRRGITIKTPCITFQRHIPGFIDVETPPPQRFVDTAGLLADPWVASWAAKPDFHQYSVSQHGRGEWLLLAEFNKGQYWHVLGCSDEPLELPAWVDKKGDTTDG